MSKRVATSVLNHDNWDKEEKPEDAGTFRKANDSIMQSRLLRQAKRRTGSSPLSSDTGEKKNIFANFSGFKMSSNTALSSFNFGTAGAAPTNGSTKGTEAVAPGSLKFGGAGAVPTNVGTNAAEAPSGGANQAFGATKKIEEASTQNYDTEELKKYLNMPANFYSDLKSLNICLSKWVQIHVEKNSCCVLSPVFRDYEKHISSLYERYVKEKEKHANTSPVTKEIGKVDKIPVTNKESAMEKPFSFGFSAATSIENFNSGGPTSSAVNTFGKTQGDKKSESEPSRTGAGTITVFGQSFAPPTQSSAGSSTDDNKAASQFSFGSEKPFTFGNVSKPVDNKNNDKEDSDEPPKAEFTPVVEKDAFFSQRCKVFVKKGDSYQDRGVGTLYLKPVSNSSKTQLLVRADTSLGNVLLNTLLFQSMPLQRTGHNNVIVVCIPTPDAEPPPIPVLLRVKTAEDADSLLKKLEEYVK